MRFAAAMLYAGLILSPAVAAVGNGETATRAYLRRIAAIDRRGPGLGAIMALNPDALSQARALDAERKAGHIRGPLHGLPILIKDNVETADRTATTAGSLALSDNVSGRDAPIVARLRAVGALILGKTNMSEWANFRSPRAVSGWSAVGGLVRNPYALDRTACGSSSGSAAAVAAGMATMAIGTETDGSIVCPASTNGLVGVKPTLGLVSRTGIIPISASQDTAGPMARTVREAAILLTVIAGSDPADPATAEADLHKTDYAAALTGSVKGVRMAVLRDRVGNVPAITTLFDRAVERLRAAGAVIVEVADSKIDPKIDDYETAVLLTEFKAGLNAYLASTPSAVKTRTLVDLIAFNTANTITEMPWFGQELFVQAEATNGLRDPAYLRARAESKRLAGPDGIDRLLAANQVAMLIQPTQGFAWLTDPVNGDQPSGPSASTLPAVAGYPHVTVPMGQDHGLPVGMSFIGPRWSEASLLNAALALEQATGPLPPPGFAKTIPVTISAQ